MAWKGLKYNHKFHVCVMLMQTKLEVFIHA